MKIKLCEINTIPGDFEGNTKKIIEELNSNDDVYIFPELSIPGYLCQDLMYFDDFINKNLEYLDKIRELAGEKIVVVGLVTRNLSGEGKPFYNSAAVIMGGHIIGFYHKMLLPFYDVFHEPRYFEPGTSPLIFKIGDLRCGVVICEDAWNDKGQEDYNYHNNPIQLYRDKVDIIFSLNSSPWYIDKHILRREMLEQIVESWNKPLTLVYTNQIGGQDDLVFDGNSMIVRGCNGFSETIKTRNYDTNQPTSYEFTVDQATENVLRKNLVLGLRDYITKSKFKRVIVGSSGGIDSALVLSLACEAIGPENVYGLIMPTINNQSIDEEYALKLHKSLGCNTLKCDVDYVPLLTKLNQNILSTSVAIYNDVADQNIQARLRDVYIMHYANAYNLLPLATGNKTEAAIGYYTLFDMNLGFAPIMDLYKGQVYDLAKQDKYIPKEILNRKPTASLAKDQYDEDDLLPYSILDNIVFHYVERNTNSHEKWQSVTSLEVDVESYNRIIRLIRNNEFKRRQSTLGLKVSRRAFGSGWKVPICKC